MGDLGTVLGTTSQSTPLFVVSPYNEEGYFHVAHEDGTPVAPPIRRVGSDGSKRLLPRTKEPLKVIPFCGSLHVRVPLSCSVWHHSSASCLSFRI